MAIATGDKAPDFTLPADGGHDISLGDFKGKNLVVYFYPKDNTPGCTREAIAFSEHADVFAAANTEIIGISKDSVKKHENFRKKHNLKVHLGADENGKVLDAFGVWKEKSMYGRSFMGIERATFLIDGNGVVRNVWRKVRVKGHAEAVLEAVKEL